MSMSGCERARTTVTEELSHKYSTRLIAIDATMACSDRKRSHFCGTIYVHSHYSQLPTGYGHIYLRQWFYLNPHASIDTTNGIVYVY